MTKLLTSIIFSSALIITSIAGAEESASDIFKKAAALYTEAKYDLAVKEYYKLIQNGLESGNLYYNIGNCFLKKNNIGYALLYYEKAKRLIPADEDLRANNEFAESLIKNRQPGVSRPWLYRQLDKVPLTTTGLMTLSVLLYTSIFAALTLGVFIGRRRYFTLAVSASAVLLIIFTLLLFTRVNTGVSIVLPEKAQARYEPFEKATVFFTLYEGMKVEVVDTEDKWYKIRRQDGKAGWVPKADIGLI